MIRTGRAIPGSYVSGRLSWNCGDEPIGNISYQADMTDPDNERLVLIYTNGNSGEKESIRQEILLTFTEPHYGGRRWWMVCPYRNVRCGKLYLPGGCDRFASREAWRLGYNSQRKAWHDRPFETQRRLQRKLCGVEGYDEWLHRPKGMWHRTYQRHLARFESIQNECDRVLMGWMGIVLPP